MLLFGIAVGAIVCASVVETSSWWVKGCCPPGALGLFVSRSNIYLYFGRFFTLGFNVLLAFAIERGASERDVALTLGIGFLASAVVHVILLRGGRPTQWLLSGLNRALLLPNWQNVHPLPAGLSARPQSSRLLWGTMGATLAFSLGASLPLLLAVAIPEYRMSLSYVGQIVNALGTLALLFLVDQTLFKALDKGSLVTALPSYGTGRAIAFGLAGIACCALELLRNP
jgi:hypothetical protein